MDGRPDRRKGLGIDGGRGRASRRGRCCDGPGAHGRPGCPGRRGPGCRSKKKTTTNKFGLNSHMDAEIMNS